MIRTQDRVPDIYTSDSRDFQLIGRLFDAAFNNAYLAASTIENINTDKLYYKFTDLMCKTIGFNTTTNFTYDELMHVVTSFNHLVKYKGSKHAIKEAVQLLLNSQNIKQRYYISWDDTNKKFTLMLPKEIQDTRLLDDLFTYILPFGWVYEVALVGAPDEATRKTQITSTDSVRVSKVTNVETSATNYIKFNSQGVPVGIESMDYIGQVPIDEKFISPAVGLDNIQSTDPDEQ